MDLTWSYVLQHELDLVLEAFNMDLTLSCELQQGPDLVLEASTWT